VLQSSSLVKRDTKARSWAAVSARREEGPRAVLADVAQSIAQTDRAARFRAILAEERGDWNAAVRRFREELARQAPEGKSA